MARAVSLVAIDARPSPKSDRARLGLRFSEVSKAGMASFGPQVHQHLAHQLVGGFDRHRRS